MKFLTIVFSIAVFSGQALACTSNDSSAQSKLISAFQLNGKPIDWVSVRESKQGPFTKIQLDRSFPITVFATNRINSSRIQFKRDNYDLSNATICMKGKNILIVHPKGELLVRRHGNNLETSQISLRKNEGIFSLKLRPKSLLGNQRSINL